MFDRHSLNPQQRLAVETLHGPILILAGAGTGKTRVITCRMAQMIRQGIPPGQILAVTFTNKAAREMQHRVMGMLPRAKTAEGEPKPERPTICTFHSLGVRILRQHIERLGYKPGFVIYDEAEQLGVVRRVLSHISPGAVKIDPAAVLGVLSRHRNAGPGAAVFADEQAVALAERVRSRYESALRACNAVDFDDLLLLTLRLLTEHPDVLEQCRSRFRYVMVDEYQDTNAAQFRLVHLLARKHRNLCVVGDDDQSIYGWRGAEIANLLDLEQHFPEVKVIKLEQNYRSTNTILRAANALIRHNVRRREKRLWSAQGQGTCLTLHVFSDDDDEARSLVEGIEFARHAKHIGWSQHAILFRTNNQSRPFETALRQAGVRYHLVGGQSFYDRREVRDLLAYLKVFLNPHDDISLLRIANVPARGLSDVTMERLLAASHERKSSVFGAMQDAVVRRGFPGRTRESIDSFLGFVTATRNELAAPAVLSLRRWAEKFLTAVGYEAELRRQEKDPEAAENRIRNVKELVALLEGEGAAAGSGLDGLHRFLQELALDTEREEEKEVEGEAVTLITMHSCKGLEFPHVYVAGLEDGLLPHSRSKLEGTLDEERRLLYVALTRAQQTLTLSYCCGRRRYGQLMPCHPSPFLKELPADLIELADEKSRQPVPASAGKGLFAAMRSALE